MEGEDRYHLALDFTNNEDRDRDRLLSTCAANLSLRPLQLPLYRIVFASCEKKTLLCVSINPISFLNESWDRQNHILEKSVTVL